MRHVCRISHRRDIQTEQLHTDFRVLRRSWFVEMVAAVPDNVQHFIAGITAGLVSTAGLYPLELVKTRMQVIDGKDHEYRTLRSSMRVVLKNEGLRGFYQGMAPALFAASGSWGGYFYFYELSKRRKSLDGTRQLTTTDHLLSGVEAGSMLVFIFNPFWVVKTRLALQGAETASQKRYDGMFDALKTIAREEGMRGLYKGLVPALLLTSHGAIQFAVYESMKKLFESFRKDEDKAKQPAFVSALLGGGSKIIASTATYPYQVIKSRLQQRDQLIQGESSRVLSPKYSGTWDCIRKVWRSDGIMGFFRGVVPNALKVAPSSALTFLVYEETMHLLKKASMDVENSTSLE